MSRLSAAQLARREQLARDLAEARDRFERTNFVVAEPDAEAPTLPGKGNKELELLLKKEWLSRVRGVRWSGTDDELKRAYTAERKRRSRPADDGAARRAERHAAARGAPVRGAAREATGATEHHQRRRVHRVRRGANVVPPAPRGARHRVGRVALPRGRGAPDRRP